MIRRPPTFTRPDTLFPYTTLFRSAERFAQDRQLLIFRPTATPAHDRDPTAHTITHMTTHENTRSRRSAILAHHRSSQRAAISTPQQLPARWPSGHGYVPTHISADARSEQRSEARRVGKECVRTCR